MKRLIRDRLRRQVVVTLKSGQSFRGVLFAVDSEALVLREAEGIGIGERRSNVVVDGEVLCLWADIDYLQLP